jgi:hypothetical protein
MVRRQLQEEGSSTEKASQVETTTDMSNSRIPSETGAETDPSRTRVSVHLGPRFFLTLGVQVQTARHTARL